MDRTVRPNCGDFQSIRRDRLKIARPIEVIEMLYPDEHLRLSRARLRHEAAYQLARSQVPKRRISLLTTGKQMMAVRMHGEHRPAHAVIGVQARRRRNVPEFERAPFG